MNDILKVFQALENSNILLKTVIKTIKNETKKQNEVFLGMLFGNLGASLLRNMLPRKWFVRAGYGYKNWEEIIRAGYRN